MIQKSQNILHLSRTNKFKTFDSPYWPKGKLSLELWKLGCKFFKIRGISCFYNEFLVSFFHKRLLIKGA